MENVMVMRIFGLLAAVVAFIALQARGEVARAAEIKLFTSVALSAALNELAPAFEKASGDKLTIVFGLAAEMKKRVLDVAGPRGAGAARPGAPKPDIGTADALKRTLLAANSISYSDPAKGGVS